MRNHDTGPKPKTDTQSAVRALIAAAQEERARQSRPPVPPAPRSPSPKR